MVTVHIRRNGKEEFTGAVVGETTTHYKVVHETNEELGELFAKHSKKVWCKEGLVKAGAA